MSNKQFWCILMQADHADSVHDREEGVNTAS